MNAFLKGFFATTLILFLATAVFATWYASRIDMGGNTIAWSSFTPTSSSELATKTYVDGKALTTTCAFVSVGTTDCSSSYCYANKPTADKVCRDKGYNFSTSYRYYKAYQSSAYLWTGSAWTSMSGTDSYAPAPIGGGQLQATGASTTDVMTYVYCCKVS